MQLFGVLVPVPAEPLPLPLVTSLAAALLATTLLFTLQLEGGLLVLLGLLLSHLSTLLLLLADAATADEVEDQEVVDVAVVDADADADVEESNDGGNAIEAIVVVDAAATIFDEEALRTQLSKLDTKVSSAEPTPTPPPTVVHGDAALYSVAEVICFPMSMGSGDTEADAAAVPGNGLPAILVTAEEFAVNTCCCCCCRNLLAGGRETTTKYRVLPARSDSSLTAILSVSSGRSRLNMDCRCCWMSLPPEVVDVDVVDEAVEEPEIESRSSALSERERREVPEEADGGGGGAGSRGGPEVVVDGGMASEEEEEVAPPRSGDSSLLEPSIRAVPLPAK